MGGVALSTSASMRASHSAVLAACTAAKYSASAVLRQTMDVSLVAHMTGQP